MPSECSLEHLYHIRGICIKNNDLDHLKYAEQLISYEENPYLLYAATTKEEALVVFEKHLGLPLIKYDDWFK